MADSMTDKPKVALVADDLIQFGGAEKVLIALHEIWPEAPVYTSVASKKWVDECARRNITLKTSYLQKFPCVEKLNRYYSAFFAHMLAFESFDFSEYDIVISSSARYAHGVITKPKTKHICYMHSPGRMFWEPEKYFLGETYGVLKPLKFLAKPFLSIPLHFMRLWDYYAVQRVDCLIGNSEETRSKIKKTYGRDASVIYPFYDGKPIIKKPVLNTAESTQQNYFVVMTRLVSWKRVGIAIEACNKLKLPLKILGSGPDFLRLKKLAGPTVELLGYVSEDEKFNLLNGCRAFIQTQKEDFGIGVIEALSMGKPVIAFGEGGVLETVQEGKTGAFFNEQSADSLASVLESFSESKYPPEDCINSTKLFAADAFKNAIKSFVDNVYLNMPDSLSRSLS